MRTGVNLRSSRRVLQELASGPRSKAAGTNCREAARGVETPWWCGLQHAGCCSGCVLLLLLLVCCTASLHGYRPSPGTYLTSYMLLHTTAVTSCCSSCSGGGSCCNCKLLLLLLGSG